jgi:hypothetical protein
LTEIAHTYIFNVLNRTINLKYSHKVTVAYNLKRCSSKLSNEKELLLLE